LTRASGFGIGCPNPDCRIRYGLFDGSLEEAVQTWNFRGGGPMHTVVVEPLQSSAPKD
jgi:hypothetical protein